MLLDQWVVSNSLLSESREEKGDVIYIKWSSRISYQLIAKVDGMWFQMLLEKNTDAFFSTLDGPGNRCFHILGYQESINFYFQKEKEKEKEMCIAFVFCFYMFFVIEFSWHILVQLKRLALELIPTSISFYIIFLCCNLWPRQLFFFFQCLLNTNMLYALQD